MKSISVWMDREEFDKWLSKKERIEKSGKNGIIKSRNISERSMSNGLRTSPYHILSDAEIEKIKSSRKGSDLSTL